MEGRLDDESICDAIDRNERAFVMAALALLTERPVETLAKIVETRNPKAVTVLAWRAGLAMRTATRLQHKLALVPPAQILHARNGVVYPMSESEMAERWELLTA
jgi:hypothetical protein